MTAPNAPGLAGQSLIVAVLTYRRPQELATLLPELASQVDDAIRRTGIAAAVLVVDNDPAASAQAVAVPSPRLRYVCERTPGIAAARNRALTEAADQDLLVFIDDDEWPRPGWLIALVRSYAAATPAGIAGPVVSEFVVPPGRWVTAGRFFDRRQLPTGTEIEIAASNNLLLDLHQVRRLELTFDTRFGLSGGSDTLFSHQLVGRGGRLIWCAEATVVDRVPPSRVTARWVLRRAIRSGNSWSRTLLDGPMQRLSRIRRRLALTVQGGARLAGGTTGFLGGVVVWSQARQARGLRTAARGLGMLAGAYGYVFSEYRRKGSEASGMAGGEVRADEAA